MRFLVTGGCGFIGTNLALALLRRGDHVRVLDNLARRGTDASLALLRGTAQDDQLDVMLKDVRDEAAVDAAIDGADVVVHLASQVAVTTSVEQPREDFGVNAVGTINVLEAARAASQPPVVLFASTNKVYGGMESARIIERNGAYAYADLADGIDENQPLDFHSPYGCSKGAADQYVRDYARIYGLRTVVFRMSCIYGPHQFGTEDQGWVAHFAHAAVRDTPVTIYGDGKQVRDVLEVADAVRAYLAAVERIGTVSGEIFNLGGGPDNTLTLLGLLDLLEQLTGRRPDVSFEDWRPGDQRVFVSRIEKARRLLDWTPSTSAAAGVAALLEWVRSSAPVVTPDA